MVFVQSYMTPDPVTLAEQDPLSKAEELMRAHHVRQFPVIDEAGRFAGIVTDRDVRSAVGYDRTISEKLRVAEIMTADPKTLRLSATLDEALAMFCRNSFNAFPILKADRLVGIITRGDVLRAFHGLLGLDQPGARVEIALPNLRQDLADAFKALQSYDGDIVGAVVGRMRRDGDEPSLYLKVTDPDGHEVEEHLRRAGLIVLVPEHR